MKDKHCREGLQELATKLGGEVMFYDCGVGPNVLGVNIGKISRMHELMRMNAKLERKITALMAFMGIEEVRENPREFEFRYLDRKRNA